MVMSAVDHVSFTVADLDRSVDFYRSLLGAEPLSVRTDSSPVAAQVIGYPSVAVRSAYFPLPGVGTVLELFQYLEPPGETRPLENRFVGNGHLGLVVDDLDSEFARLALEGATFASAHPITIESGPWRGSKAVYLRDPDGITVELLESPPGPEIRFAESGAD